MTRKKVPTATATQASNSKQAPSSATTKRKSSSTIATTQSLDTIEEEEETSPTIRRILEKTGCSSRQELLARRAAQVNTNANGSKSATRNGSKPAAPNVAKAAPNGSKVPAPNGSKSKLATNRNGSTNPKKKVKSKCSSFL